MASPKRLAIFPKCIATFLQLALFDCDGFIGHRLYSFVAAHRVALAANRCSLARGCDLEGLSGCAIYALRLRRDLSNQSLLRDAGDQTAVLGEDHAPVHAPAPPCPWAVRGIQQPFVGTKIVVDP